MRETWWGETPSSLPWPSPGSMESHPTQFPFPYMSYVELYACSAFSFLRGASFPEELVETAAHLGMPAMALCDRAGVYGAPRFFAAAKKAGVRAIIDSELPMEDASVLAVLVEKQIGYKNLCRLLTRAHLRAPKGAGAVHWDELPE